MDQFGGEKVPRNCTTHSYIIFENRLFKFLQYKPPKLNNVTKYASQKARSRSRRVCVLKRMNSICIGEIRGY